MRSSSRFVVVFVSALILGAAFSVYSARRQSAMRATQLLTRSMSVDNDSTYAATSTVLATYGGRAMTTQARVVRAPRKLSITYLSGERKGLQSGYNERWFWRKAPGAPMQAYAEVKVRPEDMAKRRFALMMQNYHAVWMGEDSFDGHTTDIVEVRPKALVDGAHGPFKRLWIDRETGLSLRTDAYNYQRQPVMSTTLTQVDWKPQIASAPFATPDQMFQVARRDGWTAEEMGDDRDGVVRKSGVRLETPRYLPQGFAFDAVGVHHCDKWGTSAVARYIDGINALTIFAMPATKAKFDVAKTVDGARGACDFGPGTMISIQKNGLQLVAVGDLPPATLQRVLDTTDVALAAKK